ILAYLQEVDAGRPPEPREFLRRYPDLAAELEVFLADHLRVARLTADLSAERGADSAGLHLSALNAPPPTPRQIGGYGLLRLLGAGGMGRVYEAEDGGGRRVALKLLASAEAASRVALERFRREGRLAGMISHPRCVFVLAADAEGDQPYIAMELMS